MFQSGVLFVGSSSAPVHRQVWAKEAGAGVWRNDPPSSWATAGENDPAAPIDAQE